MLGCTGPAGAEDDYEILELLELSGGQGFVFRARLTSDRLGPGSEGTEVSLKQLIDGAVGVDRIRELDQVIAPRTHPHLSRQLEVFQGPPITVDGGGEDDREALTYVAARWVHGETIDRAAVGVPLERKLRWIRQIGDALDFLHGDCHASGPVLHRDIKPHNVIVDRAGDAVLIDPGLARPVVAGATGTPHGSPGYIPPEAQRGLRPSTAAGDRWQLAALAFALIVGEPPGGMAPDRIRIELHQALAPTHRAEPIVELMMRMLDPDPSARPASSSDWAADVRLAAVANERPPVRQRRRRRLTTITAILAVAIAAGGAGYLAANPGGHGVAAATDTRPIGNGALLPQDSLLRPDATTVSRPVTVYNKVTDGATRMREDVPAYLSTTPADYCLEIGCAIPNTNMETDWQITAVCQTIAETTTNGDDQTTVDAHNPGRYTSDLWYGITLPDHVHGYLWDGWLAPEDRGGFNLPQC